MSSHIIITVPHSVCYTNINDRHCDTMAQFAAENLKSKIKFSVVHLPSNHFRDHIDLNRIESRNTDYRNTLRQHLNSTKFLIDIHSAPPGVYGVKANLIIIDNSPGTMYGQNLETYLRQSGINVTRLLGANYNDITEEARALGVPALLFEYEETLNPNEIEAINTAIANWVNLHP